MKQKIENWTGIYNRFLQADKDQSLEPKELEKLALAAYLTGKDAVSFQILERAHQGYSDKGNTTNAVRCAFWLGLMYINTGLALLRLAKGQNNAAETAIKNTLQETGDPKRRAELLPAIVDVMLAVKKPGEAIKAEKELCVIARDFNVPYLLAMCSYCRGKVSFAKGDNRSALEQLQKALKYWNSLNLPYESAYTRELKGFVYREMNDRDNSDAELMAAAWVYEQLGAIPDLERVNRLLNRKRQPETYGLSLRELQVLNLVASGKTNKLIADKLFISERTVDRHVSNIFNKLDVSSRVEATAFALKNQLLGITP